MHAAFPSPCGVWVVSSNVVACESTCQFPSPCGVWVVSKRDAGGCAGAAVSVPLRGVGCFDMQMRHWSEIAVSVPLRGVGCFGRSGCKLRHGRVSVPLRGVGCFSLILCYEDALYPVSVPLRGVGCFEDGGAANGLYEGFRPLAGCGLFPGNKYNYQFGNWFPSPCGVWVVSRDNMETKELITGFRPLAGCGLFRK